MAENQTTVLLCINNMDENEANYDWSAPVYECDAFPKCGCKTVSALQTPKPKVMPETAARMEEGLRVIRRLAEAARDTDGTKLRPKARDLILREIIEEANECLSQG